ncbi:unnamed protein product, partial [Adineta steineri]
MPSYIILNCKHEICLSCSSKALRSNDDWYIECLCNTTTSIDLRNRTIDNQAPSYQAAASLSYDADKYNNNNSTPPSSFITKATQSVYLAGFLALLFVIYIILVNLGAFYSYPLLMRDHSIYHGISEEVLFKFLKNMLKDDDYCFHRVQHH